MVFDNIFVGNNRKERRDLAISVVLQNNDLNYRIFKLERESSKQGNSQNQTSIIGIREDILVKIIEYTSLIIQSKKTTIDKLKLESNKSTLESLYKSELYGPPKLDPLTIKKIEKQKDPFLLDKSDINFIFEYFKLKPLIFKRNFGEPEVPWIVESDDTELANDPAEQWYASAMTLQNLGINGIKIMTALEKALYIDPKHADAWKEKGKILQTLGFPAEGHLCEIYSSKLYK